MQDRHWKHLAGRLATYEIFLALTLALIALARPQWGVVALGLLALLWIARWLGGGRWGAPTAMDWPILGLILALLPALWMSADLGASLVQASQLLIGIGLYYAIANSSATGWHFHGILSGTILAGTALAILGLVGASHSGSSVLNLPLEVVNLGLPFEIHANVLATALVLVLPVAVSLLFWRVPAQWPRWGRPLLAGATILMLLALLLSQSRGAYAGLLVAVLAMLAIRWRSLRWAVLGLAVAGTALLLLARDRLPDLLAAGFPGREAVWMRALYAIADFPLTGLGFGLFDRVVPVLYPFVDVGAGPLAQATHAHNLFLQVAVDLGLPGLISFLALLLVAGALAHWCWHQGVVDQPLILGLSGSLVALTTQGLVDAGLWSSRAAPLFWVLLGLLALVSRRRIRKEDAS